MVKKERLLSSTGFFLTQISNNSSQFLFFTTSYTESCWFQTTTKSLWSGRDCSWSLIFGHEDQSQAKIQEEVEQKDFPLLSSVGQTRKRSAGQRGVFAFGDSALHPLHHFLWPLLNNTSLDSSKCQTILKLKKTFRQKYFVLRQTGVNMLLIRLPSW